MAITGAGGFLGTAVCRFLALMGCEIRALVGPPTDPVMTPPGIAREYRAVISDRAALLSLLAGGVDAVIHLAGPPSVGLSFDDPMGYVNSHTGGTANVLDACRRTGAGPLVYVSSAEVYGRPRTDPVDESHPLEARSPYAAAKIGAEQMVRAFDHAYGTASVIIRPFSVYGPGMGQHALLPTIFRQFASSDSIRLADLRPERDYCHVDDVARAIVAAAGIRPQETIAINVGSGIGTSVGDLTQGALRLAGINRRVQEDGAARRPGNADIMRLVADRRLAAARLGWEPRISLEAGLRDMLPVVAGAT